MARPLLATLTAVTAMTAMAGAKAQEAHDTMPAWWTAHVEFITRDGGTWVADNPANESDPAQPDAYGMEWRAGYGGHVLIGRLFGLEAGVEVAEYWTFREFWHPGEQRAILEQWGGRGTYGAGESTWEGEEGVADQTFWLPDGRHWRVGHRTREYGDTYVTAAFEIDDDGSWTPTGSFTWRRQQPSATK